MFRHRHRRAGRAFSIVAVGVLGVTLAGTAASAQSGSAPGVSKDAVKLGFIWSGTGVAAPNFEDSGDACQARVDAQNAKGGVNGRKIELETVDDKSSGANLTGAKDLVENRKVYAVVNNSSFAFLSYRYLKDKGVPLIGGGFDGTYYSEKGNENIISAGGNGSPPPAGIIFTNGTDVAKKLGATKIGSIGYGISPSSTGVAKDTQKYAAKASGLDPVYLNTAVDFGTTDVGPIVLGLKNAGADAVYLPLDGNTNLAIAQGLRQNGVEMKAVLMASGYGQAMLDSPITKTLDSREVVSQVYKPAELKSDPAVKKFRADLKKYADITGVPDYGAYTGYIACDMAITGIELAGKNPTQQGFIDGLHKLGTYKAADLTCAPVDISLENFGKTPAESCQYFVTFKNGKFVVMNKGKPIIGEIVGDPTLLAANKRGEAAEVTTTAPPAS
ncbi:MAG TPA: ABC transporter substrate-binding protein [Acidimicrobiia bacterium]|nr:ABC transporter substrate-binding protein [Acidimicrobiia bacterium]